VNLEAISNPSWGSDPGETIPSASNLLPEVPKLYAHLGTVMLL
jgi:hypothetical protein